MLRHKSFILWWILIFILIASLILSCRTLIPSNELPVSIPAETYSPKMITPSITMVGKPSTKVSPTPFLSSYAKPVVYTPWPYKTAVSSLTPTLPPAWNWPISLPEEQGIASNKLAEMLMAIRMSPHFNDRNIHSILIVRHGHLVMEAYFSPFHANAVHQLASCTKSVTSALVGIAIEKGLLKRVDEPVWELFPEVNLDDPRKKTITIDHFLSMSSGLEWPEGEIEYRSPNNPYSATSYLSASTQYVFDQPIIHTPGTQFNYNSGGSHMLSVMVSRASRMSTLEFARRELFAPLGIADVRWDTGEDGINLGGSGLYLLPRDMAKFGQLYLQNGRWDEKHVISPYWVKASTQKHISLRPGVDYGYQWWIPVGEGYLAIGWGQQNIWVLPAQDMVVVITAGRKNDQWLSYQGYMDKYILPSIKSEWTLPANPQGEEKLIAELEAAKNPLPHPVKPLPQVAQQIINKTYLITGASITLGLQSITIQGYTPNEALIRVGLTHEDVDLRAGLDGVFRRSLTKTGEIALKGTWEDEHTLALDWQDVNAAERALIHLTYQGESLHVKVDLHVEGISEESEGSLLR